MKKICFVLFIMISVQASAQQNDYTISMNGLGALKLGMSHSELEKTLNKKIVLTKEHQGSSGYADAETAVIKYKNIDVQLEFFQSYYAPNKFRMRLIGIRASSPLCKTITGIGVGSDWLKIIADYDNYHVKIQPGHVNYYETEKGEGKSTLSVLDDAASTMEYWSDAYTMVFFLLNKKVVSFELKAKLKDERD